MHYWLKWKDATLLNNRSSYISVNINATSRTCVSTAIFQSWIFLSASFTRMSTLLQNREACTVDMLCSMQSRRAVTDYVFLLVQCSQFSCGTKHNQTTCANTAPIYHHYHVEQSHNKWHPSLSVSQHQMSAIDQKSQRDARKNERRLKCTDQQYLSHQYDVYSIDLAGSILAHAILDCFHGCCQSLRWIGVLIWCVWFIYMTDHYTDDFLLVYILINLQHKPDNTGNLLNR